MSKYNAIKTATDANIKANGRKEITGPVLNAVLNAIIDSLGKYYQFVGLATPSLNPGTPDQNVAYFAISEGTYEHFGGLTVGYGELTILVYDGEWRKATVKVIPDKTSQLSNDTGFVSIEVFDLINYYTRSETYTKAEVDQMIAAIKQFRFELVNTLPTASADTMYIIYLVPSTDPATGDVKDEWITIENGGVYSWEKIGRTTIDLSNYPTRSEMATAIDTALASYITGVTATVDNNTGIPSVDVSFSNGTIHLAFHNLKGAQGNTGSSVDYPFTLVNNVITDDATQALTAAMGKYLQDEITQLEQKVDDYVTFEYLKNKGLENLPGNPGNLESTYIGTYTTSKFFAVPVKPGQVVVLQRRTSASKYAVVTEFNYTPGTRYDLTFATGYTATKTIPTSGATFTVPSDAKYVIVNKTASDGTTDILASVFTIDGVNMLPGAENAARSLSTFTTGEQVSATSLSNEVALASTALVKSGAVHQKVTEPFMDTLALTRGMPGMNLVQVAGVLDNTYIEPSNTTRSYIVIKVNGGESYYCPAQTSPRSLGAFVFVKSYTYGITARTNYDFAGEYSTYIGTDAERRGTLPDDCRYILIRYKLGDDIIFPTSFVINGYDIGKSIIQNMAELRTLVQNSPLSIEKEDSGHFWVKYNNGSKTLKYRYGHYYNKFDSVEYVDGQGVTQTKANVVSSDIWANYEVYVDSKYIAQGNTNFINKPEGGSYSGDAHGLEVALYEKFYLDGNEIDIDAMANGAILYGHIFSNRRKSVIYQHGDGSGSYTENIPKLDTDGNPIVSVVHSMETTISGNTMDIDNKLIIQKDNFKFAECYGAMLEVYYNVLSDVITNNSEETINHNTNAVLSPVAGSTITLANIYQHGNKVVMVGDTFKVTQESIPVIPSGMNPGVYFNDYSGSRLKCYFQPVPTSVRSGGQAAMTFNTGDVVAVKNHRLTEF